MDIEKANRLLECGICQEVVGKNLLVLPCQHSFCASCIRQQPKLKCALCRKPFLVSDPKPDITKIAVWELIPAQCPGKGCTKKALNNGNIESHIEDCEHVFQRCANRIYGCKHKFQRSELGDSFRLSHETRCKFEKVDCHCGESVTLNDLAEHGKQNILTHSNSDTLKHVFVLEQRVKDLESQVTNLRKQQNDIEDRTFSSSVYDVLSLFGRFLHCLIENHAIEEKKWVKTRLYVDDFFYHGFYKESNCYKKCKSE
jgi:hypothetical protein